MPLDTTSPLSTLRPDHPRVLADAAAFERVRAQAVHDRRTADGVAAVRAAADKLLDQPTRTHDIPDGKRLLEVSREVVDRVSALAFTFRLGGGARYRDRAVAELEAVCAFPDWNPGHFLDTGEMAYAVALGYDWLYDDLTDAQRCTLREGIVRHAFGPALPMIERREWWVKADNNWNLVCHGGLVAAAIALGDDTPQESARVIRSAVENTPVCLRHFAPDGAWLEGPGYWAYSMRYLVVLLASMRSGLGHDFGLMQTPGLDRTCYFPMHMQGPTGELFNFADCGEGAGAGGALVPTLFLSQYFPLHAPRARLADTQPLRTAPALLFDAAPQAGPDPHGADAPPPLDAHFRGVECVTLRSAWDDPDAWFLAAQCGRNTVGHNQLDKGSFVLDAGGQRFAVDMSPDDYNLPGFFGTQRYDYYRNRAEGHNTLVLAPDAGHDQDPRAGGSVTSFDPDPRHPRAVLDLTPCYRAARRAQRTLELPGRRSAKITDVIELDKPGDVWWFLHTRADVALADDGRSATLTRKGVKLTATLDAATAPAARFQVLPATPLPTSPNPPGQNPNNGARLVNNSIGDRVKVGELPRFGDPDPTRAIRKLALHLTAVTAATIAVTFTR